MLGTRVLGTRVLTGAHAVRLDARRSRVVAAGLEGRVERVAEGRGDLVDDVLAGVGLAQEPRLAGVRLGHRPAGMHPDRHRVVELVVGGRPVAVLGRGLVTEHDPEHRRVAGEHVRQAARVQDLPELALDGRAEGGDRGQGIGVAQDPEGRDGGRGGDPVAGVRPAVADLVGQDRHDLVGPAERGGRVAVADGLGERREVGRDPEVLGRPAAGDPEAGLDLVEDQQRAELLRERPDLGVEALLRKDRQGVAHDRLDDDGRDVMALPFEDPAEDLDVVVAGRDDRPAHGLGDAATPGQPDRVVEVAERGDVVRGDRDQGVVVDAVVLALELHDLAAAGVGPGDAHRVHRRLGPRDRHPGLADPARHRLDELHGLDLVLGGQREAHAAAHPEVDVVVDPVVGVAEDDRAVAHPEVDVLVAVDVPDATALAAFDVDRVVAPGPEVRVGATGEGLERPPVEIHLAGAAERRGGPAVGHGRTSWMGFRNSQIVP